MVAVLLRFPLPGYTPYTAPVSTVMDNSVLERTPISVTASFTSPADVIKAFNGETRRNNNTGLPIWIPASIYWPAYQNSTHTDFFPPSAAGVRPLNYINGPYLSYSGSPGYNYQVPQGTPVLATADGKLYKVRTPRAIRSTARVTMPLFLYTIHSYIDHQNGYISWYLYAPLTPAILAQISAKRVCPGDQGADHRQHHRRSPAFRGAL